jgi:hypothetical protein
LYSKLIPDFVGPQNTVFIAGFKKRRQRFDLIECFERQVRLLFAPTFRIPKGIVIVLP